MEFRLDVDCVARGLLLVGTESPEEQEADSSARETPITKVAKRVIFIFFASLLDLLTESYPFRIFNSCGAFFRCNME